MPDEPVPDDAAGLRAANARLRGLLAERDADIAGLEVRLGEERELRRRLELRLAELERRLGMDSTDSGTPSSREQIGAREARRARQQSERERRKDRRRGGQPGHQGKGPRRDPDPDERKDAEPPAECRRCKAGLDGAEAAGSRWAQVIDVEIARKVTEWLLPGLACPCCGTVTFAAPPPGAHAGAVSYGPVLNAAAVLLACLRERAARAGRAGHGHAAGRSGLRPAGLTRPPPGCPRGWGRPGSMTAMTAALAAEKVLAADETPVNVLDRTALPAPAPEDAEEADPEEKDGQAPAGAPHVLIVRTPGRAADLPAGHRLTAQGRHRRRDPGRCSPGR